MAHARVYPRPVAMTLNGSMSYKNSTAPQYGEMPAAAIATGAVDIIAPVEEMPGHLLRLQGSATDLTRYDERSGSLDAMRLEICDILRKQVGHDFSGYRSQTLVSFETRRPLRFWPRGSSRGCSKAKPRTQLCGCGCQAVPQVRKQIRLRSSCANTWTR